MPKGDRLFSLPPTIFDLLLDGLRFIRLSLQQRCTLAAENLFLRKQLALYLELCLAKTSYTCKMNDLAQA